MITIFDDVTGKRLADVHSLDGVDMDGKGSITHNLEYADLQCMRWDVDARAWMPCAEAAAAQREAAVDGLYRIENGSGSIEAARHRLAQEAALWAAFRNEAACPMLSAEAAARGITIDDLAIIISEKDKDWIAREIARKIAKLGG